MATFIHTDFEVPDFGEMSAGPQPWSPGWAALVVDEWASLSVEDFSELTTG